MLEQLFANWPLKLVAVALAFAIWVSITGEKRIVKDFAVPLELDLTSDRVVASTPPTTVTVRLRGAESLMRRLDTLPMVLRVDLEEGARGEQEVQLTASQLNGVPRGAEVEFIDPDRVRFTVDRRLRRELPVEPTFLGQPPEGYAFYGAEVRPPRLVLEGPAEELQPLELVRTNPIRLDQRRGPFEVRVAAVPEGRHVRVTDPRTVEVRVDVEVAPVERDFSDLPVTLLGAPAGAAVVPDRLGVTLSGPPALLERIDPQRIRVLADASGLARSRSRQQVGVRVELQGSKEEWKLITVKNVTRRNLRLLLPEGSSEG